MELGVTSLKNWERYVETGDNSYLNDIGIVSAADGTPAILAGEGFERSIVLTGK
jgi:hypothetical protein